MDKEKCKIYFINSVKGGSGKTTVALSLAFTYMNDLDEKYKAYKSGNKHEEVSKPQVCYIDLDMLGTGVKHIIYGDTTEDLKYFNDTKVGAKTFGDFRTYINKIERLESEFTIDCILLNSDGKKKKSFIKGNYNNYISMNVFLERAKNLLSALIEEKIYDVIVIDSSPSYDSFSRELYYFLSNLSKDVINENNYSVSVYNLFISTFENSHVLTNISCLADLIKSSDVEAENVKLVLNDTTNYLKDDKDTEVVKTLNSVKDFKNAILEEYNSIYSKMLKGINCKYEHSKQSFNQNNIVYKGYCKISQRNIFKNGSQLNGAECEYILDDNLLRELRD